MRSREYLWHLLAEAAELEHNLLCSYLFAAFSLKQDTSEDLTSVELDAVQRWRSTLIGICVEEMVHLAQVSNLLMAVGARPHFNRPNLPVAPGYHPAGIVIELAPFDLETMEHFIFLERPEESAITDSPAFEADGIQPERDIKATWLMPSAPDYATVGEFYRYLREELSALTREIGEKKLFCGPQCYQLRPHEINASELLVVTDLQSAQSALDFIVEQGEGSSNAHESSHFQRFTSIKEECIQLTLARPEFRGHRPVARNPVMRPPTTTENRIHVTGTAASPVYNVMLRCLAEVYEVGWHQPIRREALLGASITSMKTLTFLANELTKLPAANDQNITAGVSFAVLRSTEGFAVDSKSSSMLAQRLQQISGRLNDLNLNKPSAAITDSLTTAANTLRALKLG
jgi:hypothetical protein